MSEKNPLYESPGEKGKRGFEDLEYYQLALEVMGKVHAFSKTLPSDEKYDLYAQVPHASKNVLGNIAEAFRFALQTYPSSRAITEWIYGLSSTPAGRFARLRG